MQTTLDTEQFLASNDGAALNESIESRLHNARRSQYFDKFKELLYHLKFDVVIGEVSEYLDSLGSKSRPTIKSSQTILTYAVHRMLSAIDLKVNTMSSLLSYRHSLTDEWYFIYNADLSHLADFIAYATDSEICTLAIKCNDAAKAYSRIVESVDEMIESKFVCVPSHYTYEPIIQFKDCYVENSVFVEGRNSDTRPRFYIDRDVLHIANDRKIMSSVKNVDLVLDFLSNGDTNTLLHNISSFMSTTVFDRLAIRPRVAVFVNSDKDVEDCFFDLFSRAIDASNCREINVKSISKDADEIRNIAGSINVIERHLTRQKLTPDSIRSIRGDLETTKFGHPTLHDGYQMRPFCSMMASSNNSRLTSSLCEADRSRFMIMRQTRHFSEIYGKSKTAEILDSLKSDDAAQYLLERIVLAYLENDKNLVCPLQSTVPNNKISYGAELEFVDLIGVDKILGFSVKEVRDLYSKWADDEGIFSKDYLNLDAALRSKGFVKKKTTFMHINSDSAYFDVTKSVGPANEFWIYADEDTNEQYFSELRASRQNIYRATKVSPSTLSDQIIEQTKLIKQYNDQINPVVNRPVTDVYIDFHNRMGVLLDKPIGNHSFNKHLESLGFIRKNLTLSKVIMSEKDREIAEFKNTRMVRCWVESDHEADHSKTTRRSANDRSFNADHYISENLSTNLVSNDSLETLLIEDGSALHLLDKDLVDKCIDLCYHVDFMSMIDSITSMIHRNETNFAQHSITVDSVYESIESTLDDALCGYDVLANTLSYWNKSVDGYSVIRDVTPSELASFIVNLLAEKLYRLRLKRRFNDRNLRSLERKLTDLFKSGYGIDQSFYLDDAIIQFADCYIESSKFKQGHSKSRPRFFINKSVWRTVQTREVTKHIKDVDTLIDFVSGNQTELLLRNLSTFMLTRVSDRLAVRPKVSVLTNYETYDRNLFFDLLCKSLGQQNLIDQVKLEKLANRTNGRLSKMCGSLCAVVYDYEKPRLNQDVVSIIERYLETTTLNDLDGDLRFKLRPFGIILTNSESTISFSDLSYSSRQRFAHFASDRLLYNQIGEEHADRVREVSKTTDAEQYLIELLVLAHLTNIEKMTSL